MGQALSYVGGGGRGEERHDSGVLISNQGIAGMYRGGGVIRGGVCPKLGQRLSRGDDKRTGDRSLSSVLCP